MARPRFEGRNRRFTERFHQKEIRHLVAGGYLKFGNRSETFVVLASDYAQDALTQSDE